MTKFLGLRAEDFDILGFIAFIIIVIISIIGLNSNNVLPRWVLIFLLIIGILGALIDLIIVTKTFKRNKK